MRKLILIAHTSIDGFVAGPDGGLDGFMKGEENLQFVCHLTEEADTALLGRVSFQLLDYHWPGAKDIPSASKGEIAYSEWYNMAKKIVVLGSLYSQKLSNTIVIRSNIAEEVQRIKNQIGKSILIFGSPSVSQLLIGHDLIDMFWIFVNPVIFGSGIPLFQGLKDTKKLHLHTTRQFSNGEIALNYILNGNRSD